MKKNNFSSIESIIKTVKKNGMFILVDDESKHEEMENEGDLVISTSAVNPNQINFNEVVETLSKHCDLVNLKRLSEDKDHIESAISIDINKYTQLIDIKSDLRNKFPDLAVNFVDNSGILTS